MSFGEFVSKVTDLFGENAIVRNDRERGLYLAKFDEWRLSIAYSGKRVRWYNVRSKVNFYDEW